jgi:hypothetical protein
MSEGTGVCRLSSSGTSAEVSVVSSAVESVMGAGVDLDDDGLDDAGGTTSMGGAERLGVLLCRGRPHSVPIHEELALLDTSFGGTSPGAGAEEEEALMVCVVDSGLGVKRSDSDVSGIEIEGVVGSSSAGLLGKRVVPRPCSGPESEGMDWESGTSSSIASIRDSCSDYMQY